MATDLLILGLVALFAVLGHRSGTFKQLTHWAGVVLGRALGKPLALILTLALAQDLGLPPVEARVGISILCFYFLYAVGTVVGGFLLHRFAGKHKMTRADRVGGLVLGLGNGAVVLLVLLSGLLFFERPLVRSVGHPPGPMRHSVLLALLRRHNLFGDPPLVALAKVQKLMEAARDPRSAEALASDPELKALLEDPGLKASLQDDELARAIRSGDWSALRKDPRVVQLLNDPRLSGSMSDPFDDADSR